MRKKILFLLLACFLAMSGWAQTPSSPDVSVISTPAYCANANVGTVTITITATGQYSDRPSDYYVRIKKSSDVDYGSAIAVNGRATNREEHRGSQGRYYTYTHTWSHTFTGLEAGEYYVKCNTKNSNWKNVEDEKVTVEKTESALTLKMVSTDCNNRVTLRVDDPNNNYRTLGGLNYYRAKIDGKEFWQTWDHLYDIFFIQTYAYVKDSNAINYDLVRSFDAGSHTVVVMDKYGCTDTLDFAVNATLSDPSQLIVEVKPNVSAINNNGEIKVSVKDSVGRAPFIYSLDGDIWQNEATFTGLAGDTNYMVYVKDSCENLDSQSVFVPQVIICTVSSYTDASCYGGADGSITLDNSMSGTYQYRLGNGEWQDTNVFDGLAAGTYTVYTRKMDGDVPLDSASTVQEISQPDAITFSLAAGETPCSRAATTLTASDIQGGTGTLSYAWSSDSSSWITSGATTEVVTITPQDTNATFYCFTATDENGCSFSDSISVAAYYSPIMPDSNVTICDSFRWDANNVLYTASTKVVDTLATVDNNCDSIVSLNLTVYYNSNTAYDTSVYYAYTWKSLPVNDGLQSPAQLVELNKFSGITIGDISGVLEGYPSPVIVFEQGAESDFLGHGTDSTYKKSTKTVGRPYFSADGCLSYDTLNLTIDSLKWDDNLVSISPIDATGYKVQDGKFSVALSTDAPGDFYAYVKEILPKHEQKILANGNYIFEGLYANTYTVVVRYEKYDSAEYTVVISQPDSLVAVVPNDTVICANDSVILHGSAIGGVNNYLYSWTVQGSDAVISDSSSLIAKPAAGSAVTYIFHVADTNGNMASNPVTVTAKPVNLVVLDSARCDNDLAFEWNGIAFSEVGFKYDTIAGTDGCDSINKMVLTAHPTYNIPTSDAIVQNNLIEGYQWGDTTFYEGTLSGIYTRHRTSMYGCDSVLTIDLAVYNNINNTVYDTACDNFLFTDFSGRAYDVNHDTTIVDVRQSYLGADSVVSHIVSVFKNYHFDTVGYICFTDPIAYEWRGIAFDAAGSKDYSLKTVVSKGHCDSVYTHLLVVNPVYDSVEDDIEFCDSTRWTGNTLITESFADSLFHFQTVAGCDSTVLLTSVAHYNSSTGYKDSAYYTYTWDAAKDKGNASNATYTESGDFEGTIYYDVNNCASYDTLHLLVKSFDWIGDTIVDTTVTEPSGFDIPDAQVELRLDAPVEGNYYAWIEEVEPRDERPLDKLDTTLFENLPAGIYHLKIRYEEYDTITLEVRISQPDPLIATGSDDVELCAAATANLSISAQGGVGEYSYSWHMKDSTRVLSTTSHLSVVTPKEAGTYFYIGVVTDENGVIDSASIKVAVNPTYSIITLVDSCDRFKWIDDSVYRESTTDPTFTYKTIKGCDSTYHLNLAIHYTGSTAYTAENYYTYTWDAASLKGHAPDQTFTASGTYVGPEYKVDGLCPSNDTLHLTIDSIEWDNDVVDTNIVDPTCSGCDDGEIEVVLDAPLDGNYYTWIEEIVPHNDVLLSKQDSYTFPNLEPGVYHVGIRYEEYDTFYVVVEIFNPIDLMVAAGQDTAICFDQDIELSMKSTNGVAKTFTYVWKKLGHNDTISTDSSFVIVPVTSEAYVLTVTDGRGSKASDTVVVAIRQHEHVKFVETACDSFVWINNWLARGVRLAADASHVTFDSSQMTFSYLDQTEKTYTIQHTFFKNNRKQLGMPNPFVYVDTFKVSDKYHHTYTDRYGCFADDTLQLTINPSYAVVLNETACDSFVWNDSTYRVSSADHYDLQSVADCDSVVDFTLTIHVSDTTKDVHNACDSLKWLVNGKTYKADNFVDTVIFKNIFGCDSIVELSLTVNASASSVDIQHGCDSLVWNNKKYRTSNFTDTMMLKTVNNCDSIITLNLTMGYANTGVETRGECDSYLWIDSLYTASTTTVDTLTNVSGCDSVITLNLTISSSSVTYDNQSACDEFVWPLYQKAGFDSTFTASTDTFYYKTVNKIGCDSLVYLVLDLHKSFNEKFEAVVCDSLVIDTFGVHLSFNETFAKTVPFDVDLTDNCDTIVRFNLVVNYSAHYDFLVSCDDDSYTWSETGETYTNSGDYYVVYPEVTKDGCDSIIKLTLVITGEGIGDVENIQLSIYPNPTTGVVNIEGADIQKVEILDLYGRQLSTFEGVNTIDIANLAMGTYMLRIYTPQGTALQRIVKR